MSLAGAFTDPEGDPLTYGVQSSSGRVLLVNPPAPGETTFPIRAVQAGTSTVTVTATDGHEGPGRPAVQQFDVVVAQVAPPAIEGVSVTLDPAGNAVSVSWTVLPDHWAVEGYVVAGEQVGTDDERWSRELAVTAPPAEFSDVPAGSYRFRARADNAVGEGAWSPWVDVTVEPGPPVTISFASGELVSQDPRRCPAPTYIGDRAGYITLELDRPVDFEVRVEVVPIEVVPVECETAADLMARVLEAETGAD